jgi:hypothetical protein
MSAFFVSRQTIHDAVTAWCWAMPQPRSQDMLDGIGRTLWGMNAEAMRQRYPSIIGTDEDRDNAGDAAAYAYRRPDYLTMAQAAKSVACLHYQCSEGDVPETWHGYSLLTAISNAMGEPLGYDDAIWDRERDTDHSQEA